MSHCDGRQGCCRSHDGWPVNILEHELSVGASITFRVGGTFRAYMERINTNVPCPDDLWLLAHKTNRAPVVLQWEGALSGKRKKSIKPGELFELNPTLMRRRRNSAKGRELA